MSAAEELKEHAEHASSGFDRRVAVTMAVIAATLAIVSVLGHLSATEELLNQQKASDQWAFYQAKSIRRYTSDVAKDVLTALSKPEDAEKYAKNAERYQDEGEKIKKDAEEFEHESHLAGRKALRLHLGEIFLEVAIVFSSLAILSKRELVFLMAVGSAVTGLIIAATEVLIK